MIHTKIIHPEVTPLASVVTGTYTNDEKVHEAVDVSALEAGLAAVHHELGVTPGEYDEAVAPLGVTQHAASQQDLVVVYGVRLVLPLHHTLKLTQLVVGRLTDDGGCTREIYSWYRFSVLCEYECVCNFIRTRVFAVNATHSTDYHEHVLYGHVLYERTSDT